MAPLMQAAERLTTNEYPSLDSRITYSEVAMIQASPLAVGLKEECTVHLKLIARRSHMQSTE